MNRFPLLSFERADGGQQFEKIVQGKYVYILDPFVILPLQRKKFIKIVSLR